MNVDSFHKFSTSAATVSVVSVTNVSIKQVHWMFLFLFSETKKTLRSRNDQPEHGRKQTPSRWMKPGVSEQMRGWGEWGGWGELEGEGVRRVGGVKLGPLERGTCHFRWSHSSIWFKAVCLLFEAASDGWGRFTNTQTSRSWQQSCPDPASIADIDPISAKKLISDYIGLNKAESIILLQQLYGGESGSHSSTRISYYGFMEFIFLILFLIYFLQLIC